MAETTMAELVYGRIVSKATTLDTCSDVLCRVKPVKAEATRE